MTSAEVLVVGGGPAGSSVATALARAGVDVLIVDRARFPRPKPCAESLSPQASRILADMNALERVERSDAAALRGVDVRAPNGTVIRGDFSASHGFRGFRDVGLSVRREVLDEILLDSARNAGARVMEGVRVGDLVRAPDGRVTGVRTIGSSGATIGARRVVAADGLRSVVANRLGLAHTSRWPRRLALVTHYSGVGAVSDRGEMHVERDGYVGIADVGGGLTTIALVVPARRAKEISMNRTEFLHRWLLGHPHLAERFLGATRATPVLATGPFASKARRAWSPGVALVGDAADFFDPFTGEGIYAALRGGELLAEAMLESLEARDVRRADAALARYDSARRREFRGKWIVERVISAVIGAPPLINRAARALSARKDLADLLVGVTGDFIPAREVVNIGYLWRVFGFSFASASQRSFQ